MKKVILLVTHIDSNGERLCEALDQTKRVQWIQQSMVFNHPSMIDSITNVPHKYNSNIGLYINLVNYNYQISHKKMAKVCEFIYLVNSPRYLQNYDKFTVDYYVFRLRRIYEMAVKAPGMFFTWEDIKNGGLQLIMKKLSLKEELVLGDEKKLNVYSKTLIEAEKAYEKCLYRLNQVKSVLE